MIYRVEVCHHRERVFIIEADSGEEAIEKAKSGRWAQLYPTDNDEVCQEIAEPADAEGYSEATRRAQPERSPISLLREELDK